MSDILRRLLAGLGGGIEGYLEGRRFLQDEEDRKARLEDRQLGRELQRASLDSIDEDRRARREDRDRQRFRQGFREGLSPDTLDAIGAAGNLAGGGFGSSSPSGRYVQGEGEYIDLEQTPEAFAVRERERTAAAAKAAKDAEAEAERAKLRDAIVARFGGKVSESDVDLAVSDPSFRGRLYDRALPARPRAAGSGGGGGNPLTAGITELNNRIARTRGDLSRMKREGMVRPISRFGTPSWRSPADSIRADSTQGVLDGLTRMRETLGQARSGLDFSSILGGTSAGDEDPDSNSNALAEQRAEWDALAAQYGPERTTREIGPRP